MIIKDFIMLTSKELNVKIKAFGKSNVSMRENFHTILKNCAAHAYEHGDVTGFDRVFAVAKGISRPDALRWVAEFGYAKMDEQGNFKVLKDKRNKDVHNSGAEVVRWLEENARKWWESADKKEDDGAKALDVAAKIEAITKSVTKTANGDHKSYNEVAIDVFAINKAMNEMKELLVKLNDAPRAIAA